jgi:hypothetical protein
MEDAMSELGPDARALLDAASSGDEPSMNDRARVRAALGSRIAAAALAGAAAATAVKSASAAASLGGSGVVASGAAGAAGMSGAAATAVAVPLGVGTKVLLSLAVISAIGAGTASYIDSTPRSAPAPAMVTSTAMTSAPTRPSGTAVATARALPAKPSETPASATTATAATLAPVAAPIASQAPVPKSVTSSIAPASSVGAELSLIRDAHAALQSGNASQALALLDDHARRFPAGALGEERDAARIFALCALGRTSEARAASDRFFAAYPRSPHAARVRSSCGGASN